MFEALLHQYPFAFFYLVFIMVILLLRLRITILELPFRKELKSRYAEKQLHEVLVLPQREQEEYRKRSKLSVIGLILTLILLGLAYYAIYIEDVTKALQICIVMICILFLQFPRIMFIIKKLKQDHFLIIVFKNKELFKVDLDTKTNTKLIFYYQIFLVLGMVAQILPCIAIFQFLTN